MCCSFGTTHRADEDTTKPGERPPGEPPPGELPPGELAPGELPPGELPSGELPPAPIAVHTSLPEYLQSSSDDTAVEPNVVPLNGVQAT
jgi:hypothetical protein